MQQVQNETKTEKKTVSPLAAGLTGIVIGAAGAAAIALSDKETRKRVTKKAKQVKDDLRKWSTKTVTDIQHRGEKASKELSEQIKAKSKEMQKTDISKEVKERLDEKEPLK